MMKFKIQYLLWVVIACCVACTPQVPSDALLVEEQPAIYPDYAGVTIPVNIAPLRFKLEDPSAEGMAVLTAGGQRLVEKSDQGAFLFSESRWKELLEEAAGGPIEVKVYENREEGWVQYLPFAIHVATDEIDDYLCYRLIPPGYEAWFEMGLYQRQLTSYEETPIIQNRKTSLNCINCHSFCGHEPDRMMFHMRGTYPGTYIWSNNRLEKIDGRVSERIASLVYPYWHPSGRYIAYSTNQTQQMFHMADKNRIEVFDYASDLLVYDVERHEVVTDSLLFSPQAFETFPSFSPDGRTLYFSSAHAQEMPGGFQQVKYSICSIAFDPETRKFGSEVDTLVNARLTNQSALFPRVSPDGNYLVYTSADYGNFAIWHKEADLYMVDLKTRANFPLEQANSPESESYHAWSSNSRWLVFTSRRDDGLYTRPYLAYVGTDGKVAKPFVLPQEHPDAYGYSLKSYNVPEFSKSEVEVSSSAIEAMAKEGIPRKIKE